MAWLWTISKPAVLARHFTYKVYHIQAIWLFVLHVCFAHTTVTKLLMLRENDTHQNTSFAICLQNKLVLLEAALHSSLLHDEVVWVLCPLLGPNADDMATP